MHPPVRQGTTRSYDISNPPPERRAPAPAGLPRLGRKNDLPAASHAGEATRKLGDWLLRRADRDITFSDWHWFSSGAQVPAAHRRASGRWQNLGMPADAARSCWGTASLTWAAGMSWVRTIDGYAVVVVALPPACVFAGTPADDDGSGGHQLGEQLTVRSGSLGRQLKSRTRRCPSARPTVPRPAL